MHLNLFFHHLLRLSNRQLKIANFDFKLDFRFDFYENDHLLKIFRLIRKNFYHSNCFVNYVMFRVGNYFLKLCPIFVGSVDHFGNWVQKKNLVSILDQSYFSLNGQSEIQILNGL